MSTPPLPGSGRAARIRRRKIKRITLFASLLVIIALLLMAVVLLAVQISRASADIDSPDEDGATTTTPSDTSAPNAPQVNQGYTAFMHDSSKMREGELVLVNKDHEYTFPPTVSHMSDIRSSRVKAADGNYPYTCEYDMLMDTAALGAFNQMMAAFYAETGNEYALIFDAYRSAERQDSMNTSTKGGYSDHHTGMLVAIKFYMEGIMYDTDDTKFNESYAWLEDNAHKFGFVVRYPNHKLSETGVSNYSNAYRYVGLAHAAYMYQNDLCLEEYVELLKAHDVTGSHLTVTDDAGVSYEIYRIAASTAAQTSVQVPAGKQYSISGDNDGGFIITVTLS